MLSRFVARIVLPSPPFVVRVAILASLAAALGSSPAPAEYQARVVVPGLVTGTAAQPPYGPPGYLSPDQVLLIEDGLAPGDKILARIQLGDIVVSSEQPGGTLGGREHTFTAKLRLRITGAGTYAGYSREVEIPVSGLLASSAFVPSADQYYVNDIHGLQGQIFGGDPDFDLLRVTAGTGFGMPSPGQTRLVRLSTSEWAVESFFDIEYRIDFIGTPGGAFAGMSGSTRAHSRLVEGLRHRWRCEVAGPGLAIFPPTCPEYAGPPDATLSLNGLPPGTPVTGALNLIAPLQMGEVAGGPLGGHIQDFTAYVQFELYVHGATSLVRSIAVPVTGQTFTGPRMGGMAVDAFPTELNTLSGQITGDPDFDLLRITAGTGFGMPSPGHTTLTQTAGGNWVVDSFFDIEYRIDFVGAPGGPLAGQSGSELARARVYMGRGPTTPPCILLNAGGTVHLPADCPTGHASPEDIPVAVNGLPPGEPLLGTASFFDITYLAPEAPGGPLDGTTQTWMARLKLDLYGTGTLSGFARSLVFPVQGTSAAGPRTPGQPTQSVPAELLSLQGQVTGDPDFDLLRITAGSSLGMPSPGHVTLTQQPSGDWAVDSFFDIEYRIDFIGAPGSPIAGLSGSTTAEARFKTAEGGKLAVLADRPPALSLGAPYPNPSRGAMWFALELPARSPVSVSVHDVAGRRVTRVANAPLEAGRHRLNWSGLDDEGARVAPGLYFIRVRTSAGEVARRVAIQF